MTADKPHWSAALADLDACSDALTWARKTRAPRAAWASCKRADWMLWIAARCGVDRKLLVLAACACARTALKYLPDGELRPLRGIETAEAWCRGEATIEQVREAQRAADAAAAAAAASASAAYAAAYAAARAAAAARAKALADMADIVRRMLPMPELPARTVAA